MIIRRRTYTKVFSEQFGYFMRNIAFSDTVKNNADYDSAVANNTQEFLNAPQYIYTKCNQPEIPVGQFPKSYRNQYTAPVTSARKGTFAVGYTIDTSTIIVFTPKYLYKSTDRGANFSVVNMGGQSYGSLPFTYWYNNTGPVVWGDNTKYCILCSFKSASAYPCYVYLYMYTYTVSSNSGQWKYLSAQYVSADSGTVFSTAYGLFYGQKVSPRGQTCIKYQESSGSYQYNLIVDFTSATISNTFATPAVDGSITRYQDCGEWYNDGTAYGAFKMTMCNNIYGENYYQNYTDYKVVAPTPNSSNGISGKSITVTDITSTLSSIRTQTAGLVQAGGIVQVASSKNTSDNLLFIYSSSSGGDGTFFVSDRNFGSVTKIIDWQDIPRHLDWYGTYTAWPSGLYVTPNNKWGVVVGNIANMIFDLQNKSFWGGAKFSTFNDDIMSTYVDPDYGFMLPQSAL